MDKFIVSARKYRPITFDSVVGQESITATLKNAIRNNYLAQAYLFCGPRGVGKTTCARIFAKTINCLQLNENIEPCNKCESCISFNEGRSYNVHELDAASNNSVDDIRQLIDKVRIPPPISKYSVYVIDEVHMLSQAAFNAFLKTLEEPPRHAIFILATTEKHKIIPTILSRCQIFDFNRIQINDIVKYLSKISDKEGNSYDNDGLNIIAQKADGALRDALSIYDQIVSFSNGEVTYDNVIKSLNVLDYEYFFKLTEAFLEQKVPETFIILDEILARGFHLQSFVEGLTKHYRDILIAKDKQTIHLLESGENIKNKYLQLTTKCSTEFLYDSLEILNECLLHLKDARNQRLYLEIVFISLARAGNKKKIFDSSDLKQAKSHDNQTNTSVVSDNTIIKNTINSKNNNNITYTNTTKEQYNFNLSSPSIKEIINKVQTISENKELKNCDDEISPIIRNKPFSTEQLLEYYRLYVENLKRDNPRVFAVLQQTPDVIDNTCIQLSFSSQTMLDDFQQNFKGDLIKFLTDLLENDNIMVKSVIKTDTDNVGNILYTAEDKFKFLVSKNEILVHLRKELNLDFE